ncbi:pentapeptide repeat-containing protein, partial [Rhodococcus qingshengii]|uniref:pentapeptide repeat-containing protein n=1 Tax=Rhodococcus qingshengii TaxID=334542 RepID=UPI0035F8B0D3
MSAPRQDEAASTPATAVENVAKEERRSALLGWTVVGILLTAGLSFVVMTAFVRLVHGEGSWWKIGDHELEDGQWFEAARVTVALVALTVAGGAAYLAYRRQRTADQNQKTAAQTQRITAQAYQLSTNQYEATLRRERRDRFTDAASQLAHTSAAVRIAGVYAMAALADDWGDNNKPNETQACIDVLCGYLRLPYAPEHAANHQTKRIITTPTQTDGVAAHGAIEEHFEYRQNDREVRKTIVRVIRNHLLPDAETSWSENGFDFQGTILEDLNFEGVVFNGPVSFNGTRFHGERTSFEGAEFHGERTSFEGAEFHGKWTLFNRAEFHSE